MVEIPPQSPLGSPLRVWTRRAFQASFPPQCQHEKPEGCRCRQPLQTLWTNLMFLLNLSNQNRLNMVLKPSKLEVVTYLDAFFVKNLHFKWNLPSSAKVFWQMWNLPYIWRASISQLNERKADWERILGEASQNPVVQLFKKLYVMTYKKFNSCPFAHWNTPPTIVYV